MNKPYWQGFKLEFGGEQRKWQDKKTDTKHGTELAKNKQKQQNQKMSHKPQKRQIENNCEVQV